MRARFALFFALMAGCGSTHPIDPSPEHPRIGCIKPTQRQRIGVEGKILPEVVRIIGTTPPEDGERWKVLRSGEYDATKWQPWSKESISFVGCGSEAAAFREVIGADRRMP